MSKKLLLADDSITIQKVIQITFAHEDYELTITDNGDAALLKAQELKPDLVMTDIYMPGKNGYELTSAIKQDPALQHVPVLLLAGSFEPFDEDKARSCKADAWIEKPFESQNLIDKVAELLNAAQAPSETPDIAPVVAEPEPVAAVEETPLAAFDEPASTAPETTTASDDPFGDISFEEEAPISQPEPVSATDDWSDVAAESVVEEPVVEEPVVEEQVVEEIVAITPESVEDVTEDFSFAEEELVATDDMPAVEEAPMAEVDLDVFEMGEDEIMPLDDDDILGAEDLEPVMPEQTLAAWSRDDSSDDVFAESLDEMPVVEDEDVFAAAEPAVDVASVFGEPDAEITPAFEEPAEIEPPVEDNNVFAEPTVEPVPPEEPETTIVEPMTEFMPEEEPVAAVVAPEPEPAAVATTMANVEAKAAALSEDELEQIIEKVVTKVVEKLAGSILERVAWDVVPELAENMIRDEIRKIKDAAA